MARERRARTKSYDGSTTTTTTAAPRPRRTTSTATSSTTSDALAKVGMGSAPVTDTASVSSSYLPQPSATSGSNLSSATSSVGGAPLTPDTAPTPESVVPQTGDVVATDTPTAPTLRDIAGEQGYTTSYDADSGQVIVRDANGRSIQFKSGEGAEYGMGGLVDGYNTVTDVDKFKQAMSVDPATNDLLTSYQATLDTINKVMGEGGTTQDAMSTITETLTESSNRIEEIANRANDFIDQVLNEGDVDSQAIIASYYSQASALLDQMQQDLMSQSKETGDNDPALQAALKIMQDEYDRNRDKVLANLNARGIATSGALAEAEAMLNRGYSNERQQLIGNFLSQNSREVTQGLTNLMGQRVAMMTQFAGMDVDSANAAASRNIQKLNTVMSAMNQLGQLYQGQAQLGVNAATSMGQLGLQEQGLRQDLATSLTSQAGVERRFNASEQRAIEQFAETMGIKREELEELIRKNKAAEGFEQQRLDQNQQRIDNEKAYQDSVVAAKNLANEIAEKNYQNEKDRNSALDKLRLMQAKQIEYEMITDANNQSTLAKATAVKAFEDALSTGVQGDADSTYKDYADSDDLGKMEDAYSYLSSQAIYTDPVTNKQDIPRYSLTYLKALKDRIEEQSKEDNDEDSYSGGILPSIIDAVTFVDTY